MHEEKVREGGRALQLNLVRMHSFIPWVKKRKYSEIVYSRVVEIGDRMELSGCGLKTRKVGGWSESRSGGNTRVSGG